MQSADDLIAEMSGTIGMQPNRLQMIIRTAPLRYKVFYIKKRSGGLRVVAQPSREVKRIQRWLVEKLEPLLPIHSAASAYRKGASIQANAHRHVRSNYLLKIDFKDFFPSILASDIQKHLEAHCSEKFDSTAASLMARVFTWAPRRQPPLRLCIGAPSSPFLSNSIMHAFDARLSAIAEAEGVEFTRYADDVTLSSMRQGVLERLLQIVSEIVASLEYPSLRLNSDKTVFASRSGRRSVTGLTLTPDRRLSIGRDRKRLIRAMYWRERTEGLSESERQRLAGLIAFADSVEPDFSTRLRNSMGP